MRLVESTIFWDPFKDVSGDSFENRDLFLTISIALSSILFISAIVGNFWGLGTIGSIFLCGLGSLYTIASAIVYFFQDESFLNEDFLEATETEISIYDSFSELSLDELARDCADQFINKLLHTHSQMIEKYKAEMENFLEAVEKAYQYCCGVLQKTFEEISQDDTIFFLKDSITKKIQTFAGEGKIAGNECLLEYYLFHKMCFLEEENLKNYILTLPNLALEIYKDFVPEEFQQTAQVFLSEAKRL